MINPIPPIVRKGLEPIPVIPTIYTDALSYGEQTGIMVKKIDECVNKVNEVVDDNNEFKTDLTNQQNTFETNITNQQNTFETNITNRQNTYETNLTNRQNTWETETTQELNSWKTTTSDEYQSQIDEMNDEWDDFVEQYQRQFGVTDVLGDSQINAISQKGATDNILQIVRQCAKIYEDVPFVINSAVNSSGSIVNLTDGKRTNYIAVFEGDTIEYYSKINSSYCMLAFYNLEKEFISSSSVVGTNSYVSDEVIVPQNAYYVIYTTYDNNTGYIKVKPSYAKSENVDDNVNNNVIYPINKGTLVNGRLADNGTVTSDNNLMTTDYFDVSEFKRISIKTITSGTKRIAFYDSSRVLLETVLSPILSSDTFSDFYPLPSETKYARVTIDNNDVQSFEVKCTKLTYLFAETNYNNILSGVGDGIVKLTTNELPYFKGLVKVDGTIDRTVSIVYIDYIPIHGFNSCKFPFSDTGTRRFAFYDKNKTFISFASASVNDGIVEIGLNSSMYYVRYNKTQTETTFVELIKNNNSIDNTDNGMNVYQKFGVCGDSLTVGWIGTGTDEQRYRNIYYSWGQTIARRNGNICLNFGKSGITTKQYMTDNKCYPILSLDDNKCQMYIVAIGTNDDISGGVGSINDIDPNDYNNNADTFYGNFAKIIQAIHSFANDAKIFVCTIPYPRNSNDKNTAIRAICNLNTINQNVYLVDLASEYNADFTQIYTSNNYFEGHYSEIGYSMYGKIVEKAINKIMFNNTTNFRTIHITPFGRNNVID